MKLSKHLKAIEQDIRNRLMLLYESAASMSVTEGDVCDYDTFVDQYIHIDAIDLRTDLRIPPKEICCQLSIRITGEGFTRPMSSILYKLSYSDYASECTGDEFFAKISSFAEDMRQKVYLKSSTDGIPNRFYKIRLIDDHMLVYETKLAALRGLFRAMIREDIDTIDVNEDTIATDWCITPTNELRLYFPMKEATYNGEDYNGEED